MKNERNSESPCELKTKYFTVVLFKWSPVMISLSLHQLAQHNKHHHRKVPLNSFRSMKGPEHLRFRPQTRKLELPLPLPSPPPLLATLYLVQHNKQRHRIILVNQVFHLNVSPKDFIKHAPFTPTKHVLLNQV